MIGKWKCVREGEGFWLVDESSDRRVWFHSHADCHEAGLAIKALLRPTT